MFWVKSRDFLSNFEIVLENRVFWQSRAKIERTLKNKALDLNPLNFVWVDDKELLAKMDIYQPTFLFYEITPSGAEFDTRTYNKMVQHIIDYKYPESVQLEDFPGEFEGAEAP